MKDKILIIEDDPSISEMVYECLTKEGYDIIISKDGQEGVDKFLSEDYRLILLDLLLPKIDGFEVLKKIRDKSSVPVLIMSAKGSDVDKALGLGFGADDYISKPFSMIELTARVKAAIRRANVYSKTSEDNDDKEMKLMLGSLTIDTSNFTVMKNDVAIKLTLKEFNILKLLAVNPKRVYTKSQIYKSIWEEEYFGDENVINVHMRRLREKIEDNPSKPEYIKTVWGIGYRFGDFE